MGTVLEDFGMKRYSSSFPLYEAIIADQDQFENEYQTFSVAILLHTFLLHHTISHTPIKYFFLHYPWINLFAENIP